MSTGDYLGTCRLFKNARDLALNDVDKDTRRLAAPRQLSAQPSHPSPQPSAAELVLHLHATHRRSYVTLRFLGAVLTAFFNTCVEVKKSDCV